MSATLEATDEDPNVELMDRAFAAAYARWEPAAERGPLGERRRRLLARARGHVLDVGAGVGANLHQLDGRVDRVTLLEPSPHMVRRLRDRTDETPPHRSPLHSEVEVLQAPGEAIPLPDDSVDVAVSTLVLCTVGDVGSTLAEIRRVLRPEGELLVLEHVRGTGRTARVQGTIRPVWRFFGRGCDLTRDTARSLDRAGFDTSALERFELTGFGPASPAIAGAVRPKTGGANGHEDGR